MPFSDYLANKMLDHTFVNTAYPPPTAWWVQLHYGDPGVSGTANAITDIRRTQVTDFTNATTGVLTNVADIAFINLPHPLAGQETVTYASVFSAETGGSFYASGQLTTGRQIVSGDILTIDAGELEFQVA